MNGNTEWMQQQWTCDNKRTYCSRSLYLASCANIFVHYYETFTLDSMRKSHLKFPFGVDLNFLFDRVFKKLENFHRFKAVKIKKQIYYSHRALECTACTSLCEAFHRFYLYSAARQSKTENRAAEALVYH